MAIDISKIFPIQSIENDILINGNGDLTIGFSIKLPETFTLGENGFDNLQNSLSGIFKLLPIGTIIHKQDFVFSQYYNSPFNNFSNLNYVQKENLFLFDTKPVLKHYSNIYFTLLSNSSKSKKNTSLSLGDYVFKKPFKTIEDNIKKLEDIHIQIFNGLNTINNIRVERLNNQQLALEIQNYWNLSYNQIKDFNPKSLNPLEINDDYIRIGNENISIISLIGEGDKLYVSKIPKTASGNAYSSKSDYVNSINLNTSFTFPITLGLPINHIVNTVIEITDNEKILRDLDIESRKISFLSGLGYAPATTKMQKIQEFTKNVVEFGYTTTKTAVNVIIHNPIKENLQKDISLVKTAFQNIGELNVWQENFDNFRLFLASMPGNTRFNDRKFTNVMEMAVCYLPKETNYYSDNDGFIYLDRFGNPVILNQWDSPFIVNRNKVIFGPSGAGKSFYINDFIDQSLAKENHVVVIDIGASYHKSCELNNGTYYDSSKKELFQFNIFPKGDLSEQEMNERIEFIYSVIRTIWKTNNNDSTVITILKKIIEEYINYYSKDNSQASIKKFSDYLDTFKVQYKDTMYNEKYFDFNSLKLAIEPYANGNYSYLLNSNSNINIINHKFIVFELESISKNENLFNIVSLLITDLVTEKVKQLPKNVKKTFIIDEALDFLKSEIGEFISYMYRTFRKKNGEVIIATQNVKFLESANNEVKESILGNTDTKILLDHSNYRSSYPKLQEYLSLTDNDILILDTLQKTSDYREFFIKMGNHPRVFRFQVSQYAKYVYSTTPNELAEINYHTQKTGNLHTGILNLINTKNQENEKNNIAISNS